jgi:hypothetical protein
MAVNNKVNPEKRTVTGIRSDSNPSTNNGDSIAIRVNEYGEVYTVSGTGTGTGVEAEVTGAYLAGVELVDVADLGAGTNYYPSSAGLDLAGYNHVLVQMACSGGVTVTFEGTIDDDGSPDWVDITKSGYSTLNDSPSYPTYVDQSDAIDFEFINFDLFRVKVVTADATNAVQLHIKRRYA